MKRNFRGMTLAALLLCASPSVHAGNHSLAHTGAGAESNTFVGDMDTRRSYHVGDTIAPVSNYAPINVGDMQSVPYPMESIPHESMVFEGYPAETCDAFGCDGGCDGMGCDSGFLNLCKKDGWIRAEGLIMFMSERRAPALVSSAAEGEFPILPDAMVEFGEELDGGVSGGFRGDVGRYFTDSFGIGGRVLWLSENGDDYSASGDGTGRSIGRPYFFVPTVNPGIAQEDALLVNQAGLFAGDVQASFSTDLIGAEAYARLTYCNQKQCRLEMIGGYSFFALDDEVRIRSRSVDLQTATATTFASSFDTENRFHGGQIGFESLIRRGRWSARALTKVHLGNMQQSVNIRGYTDEVTPGTPPLARTNSSLLVMENQGEESQDVFTFIPEMNFTLGYRFRDHVSFTVGYNFLYFDSVALAGEQINRNLDTDNLGAAVVPQGFDIVDGSLWVQGISLGASIDY
ncbi:BBP7 family outer membrane beta-barrel protein [Roseiconus nitratireducens]|uniref:BBP7 family outer membrane beta-barrel protein n=1 Tax=Roseiconus nitratireducens TaxID=2605748 RepID=A0A5M6D1K1_9BACT|nr:BBP7 family outer membrane beta-barrel protein [Roseiconus nitratireducens]KAA5540182.1 BBP7 family outer membrane beta-barrel protein [Roseiconus nitratireducens]